MIDILNKHFQDSLHINKEQSGLVQFANYLAYFLMAIPAGLIARKIGYKGGILVGLVADCQRRLFVHSRGEHRHIFGVFAGIVCHRRGHDLSGNHRQSLHDRARPAGNGATRINIAQTFNGVGWILGPIVGGYFVFGGGGGASSDAAGAAASATNAVQRQQCVATTNANAGLSTPYLGIGIFAALLLVVFIFGPVPDLHAEDESKKSADQKTSLKPSGGQLAGIGIALAIVWGLLYFFIAPIMGLVWTLLNLPANVLDPTKYGLIIVAYIGSFIVVSKNWDMFRRKHFTLGIVAQFLYVAAQTGIFSFCVNYIIENDRRRDAGESRHDAGRNRFCPVHGWTHLRQHRHQPVQAPPRARGLRGHQCGAGGGVHGRRQDGLVSRCSARSSSCP